MEIFLAILGSSVLSSVVTAIFTFIQGRKQDTLKYIGEERTKWREKIRKIAEDIEKCQYGGTGEKNIDTYLNQLQMNINTYGKFDKSAYIHDAHIWEVIEVIQNADSENVFEANKKLLLGYISLMLKEDWERSKDEVKGYSRLLLCILLHIGVCVLFGIYYFVILRLENIQLFFGILIINSAFVWTARQGVSEHVISLADTRKQLSIKKIQKNERRYNRRVFIFAIMCVGYIFGLFIFLNYILIGNVMQNIKYHISEDTVLIYTNLDKRFIPDVERELEERLGMKIETVYSEDNIDWVEERNEDLERIVKGVLIDKTGVFAAVAAITLFIEMLVLCFWGNLDDIDMKNRRLRTRIIQMKYMICHEYNEQISEAKNILEEIMQMDDAGWESETCDILLAVEYRLLQDIREQLNKKYNTEKLQVDNLYGFQNMYIRLEAVKSLEECMQKLKSIAKSKRFFIKIKISEKKMAICEIKQCIENIWQKGDIYSNS